MEVALVDIHVSFSPFLSFDADTHTHTHTYVATYNDMANPIARVSTIQNELTTVF